MNKENVKAAVSEDNIILPRAPEERKRERNSRWHLQEYERNIKDEPTWRCHQNPFIRALRLQEPVIPGEPLINS